jgi:hypothetical protein
MGERLIYADLRKSGVVSVWLGRLTSIAALDEYLQGRFRQDFGFAFGPRTAPEYRAGPVPRPVAELLTGFSGWQSFVPAAIEAAAAAGHERACCAVVFRALRYRPEYAQLEADSPLTFIGAFAVE